MGYRRAARARGGAGGLLTWGWWSLAATVVLLGGAGWWLLRRGLHRLEHHTGTDWGARGLNRIDGLFRLFCYRYHHLRADPVPLPEHGGAIVAANHVSGLDPLLLIAACRRPLRFVIAREQYERFGLQWLFRWGGCIPVDRAARPERALREALRALRAGEVVALFPHGAIHLAHEPRRKLKGGVAALARVTGCPVVPLHIEGVRGEGFVLAALWLRSRVRLRAFPPLHCAPGEEPMFLHQLAGRIEGRWQREHRAHPPLPTQHP